MKLSEAANEVIALADAIGIYWAQELPKRHPRYPIIRPGEDSGPPPPEAKKLHDLLLGLPEDQVHKLALVMCLGRGDFGTHDLAASYEAVKENFGRKESAVSLMMEKALLGDYLTDGLDELRKNHIDVDTMLATPVGSRT